MPLDVRLRVAGTKPGHPHAGGDQHVAGLGEDLVRRPVEQHRGIGRGAGLQHHDPVHQVLPDGHPVLHHHQRGPGLVQAAAHGVPDFEDADGVQVGGGLVQQDQARPHGQDAGQRQALLLPAGQGRRRVVQRQVGESDVVKRLVHARPDFVAGHGEVLGAEGDVVAHPGEDHLRFGVLLHQAGAAAPLTRGRAVDQQRTGLVGIAGLAVVVHVPQHPGEGVQQRGLAGA